MKKLWLCAFSLIAVMILFTGCEKSNNPMVVDEPTINVDGPELYNYTPPTGAFVTNIIAGQFTDVGDIFVWNDNNNLFVYYRTTVTNWYLTEYHVQAGIILDSIPYNNGGGIPGQFDYKGELPALTTEKLVTIPLTLTMKAADELYIAAHCCVFLDGNGNGIWDSGEREETGWGEGEEFGGGNWSMYFTVTVKKNLYLPTGLVLVDFDAAVGNTPYPFHIYNVGTGYSIPNDGWYPSYCLDEHVTIDYSPHWAHIYTSYSSTMPNYAYYQRSPVYPYPVTNIPVRYDRINYILNNYWPIPTGADYTFQNLQNVFWYYRGWRTYESLSAREKLIATDANNNGNQFWPSTGDWMAVIIDVNGSTQLCFFIVDP